MILPHDNEALRLAFEYVHFTNQSIFVTGKAGTGKTTFLKQIKEECTKKMVIVAPTGVAAINAGGVTMHSMFQLPLGTFLPTRKRQSQFGMQVYNDINSLFQHLRLSNDKRRIIREMELLVIDEISMVRADSLDAIDHIMRFVRRTPNIPFGGVQLLFIGDMYQLPPVVNNDDKVMLAEFYNSPYFFDSLALKEYNMLSIELTKTYRQSEKRFIQLLNNFRFNEVNEDDIELLMSHYKPGFTPPAGESFITLTTHNAKADIINQNELSRLTGKAKAYTAEVSGEFNEKAFPCERILQLKVGAQIMFVKNDKGETRRYYNGKLAIIDYMDDDKIMVRFPEENVKMQLEKEIWKNVRYQYNEEKDNLEEEILGTFTQYPIRLAWAITIHKSQGLTFEKAIIDAGEAFAPGQVYVALSRLKRLDGLVLLSRLSKQGFDQPEQIVEFSSRQSDMISLEQMLAPAKTEYMEQRILQAFDTEKLKLKSEEFLTFLNAQKNINPNLLLLIEETTSILSQLWEVYKKFENQYQKILLEQDGRMQKMNERVGAARNYFVEKFDALNQNIQTRKGDLKQVKPKKISLEVEAIILAISKKLGEINHAQSLTAQLAAGKELDELLQSDRNKSKDLKESSYEAIKKVKESVQKMPKGGTQLLSLSMFKEGKSIEQIAKERNFNESTIVGHLTGFLASGEVQINQIVSQDKIQRILNELNNQEGEYLTARIKEAVGADISYSDVKAVITYKEMVDK